MICGPLSTGSDEALVYRLTAMSTDVLLLMYRTRHNQSILNDVQLDRVAITFPVLRI